MQKTTFYFLIIVLEISCTTISKVKSSENTAESKAIGGLCRRNGKDDCMKIPVIETGRVLVCDRHGTLMACDRCIDGKNSSVPPQHELDEDPYTGSYHDYLGVIRKFGTFDEIKNVCTLVPNDTEPFDGQRVLYHGPLPVEEQDQSANDIQRLQELCSPLTDDYKTVNVALDGEPEDLRHVYVGPRELVNFDCPVNRQIKDPNLGEGVQNKGPWTEKWEPRPSDIKIEYIVVHNTLGNLITTLEIFQRGRPSGWTEGRMREASVHFILGRDGTLYRNVPDDLWAYHATNAYFNARAIGIEVVAWDRQHDLAPNPSSEDQNAVWEDNAPGMTKAQQTKLVALLRHLRARYDIPIKNIRPHCELARTLTQCPSSIFGTVSSPHFKEGDRNICDTTLFRSWLLNVVEEPAIGQEKELEKEPVETQPVPQNSTLE